MTRQTLIITLVLLCCNLLAQSQTIYVKQNSTGSGTSWQDATGSLHDALKLAASRPAAQVWVAKGTYYASKTGSTTESFVIPSGVMLYGGFKGTEVSIFERPLTPESLTILSGEAGNPAINTDNVQAVVYVRNASNRTVVDGFIIEKGYANTTGINNWEVGKAGAGLFNDCTGGQSSPRIENCVFRSNFSYWGGAIMDKAVGGSSNMQIINCTFDNNEARMDGGAICFYAKNGNTQTLISNCSFTNNKAVYGGAILNRAEEKGTCSPRLEDLQMYNNAASAKAGVIFNDNRSTGLVDPFIKNIIESDNYSKVGNPIGNSRYQKEEYTPPTYQIYYGRN